MEQDLERMLEEREIAKGQWESFEDDDYVKFPFPRKNYKYVCRIVENEDNAPESIQRALKYFDRHDIWVLRAEAYQHLAKQVDIPDQIVIAHSVYDFVYDELPGLSLTPELYGGGESFGQDRIDQAMYWLNWAARNSQDSDLINRHSEFIQEILPGLVRDMPGGDLDSEGFVDFWQQKFDAMIYPDKHCIENRISDQRLTAAEITAGYLACKVCQKGLMPEDGNWEIVLDEPCAISKE